MRSSFVYGHKEIAYHGKLEGALRQSVVVLVNLDIVPICWASHSISDWFMSTSCETVATYFRMLVDVMTLPFSNLTLSQACLRTSFPLRLWQDCPLLTAKTYSFSSLTQLLARHEGSVNRSSAPFVSGVIITGTFLFLLPAISTRSNL